MLDYIKQQLAQQQQHIQEHAVTVSEASEEQMDNAILEYAHLFDDMDDLTMEGANELRERPILDIPLEDDIELDSIEMSLTSNRVMDIPADIAAMEGAYSEQKSYNDFYQEAYKTVTKLPRESEAHFVERVKDVAEGHYNTYMEYVIQEGLFGNDMMNMDDDRVQKNVMLNFGPYKTNTYMTKVPVEYETDNKHRVNVQQVRSLPIAESYNVFESIGEVLKTKLFNEQSIDCEEVWDVATPSRIIVPKFNGDYRCIVEFDIEDGKTTYVEWSIPEAYVRNSTTISESVVERPNHEIKRSDIIGLQLESKDDYIEETYVPRTPRIPSRWVQEAIDFGGGDNADTPPAGDANATNDAPPAGDTTDTSGDQTGAPSVDTGGDENAKPAAVNDVSDAVATKVSNEANKNTADLGMDGPPTFDSNPDVQLDLDGNGGDAGNGEDVNNLEPDMSGDTSNDMGTTDDFDTPTVDDSANVNDPNMTDVNNELGGDVGNDTDMNGDMGEDLGGGSMENIDDMSIDDLLAKGEEKLKGMSIGQLKDFLNDGLGDETTTTTESVDNSIGNRLNVAIRRCLGTLNSSNKSVDQIVTEFSKESKKLNTVLGQADRSSNFDESTKTSLRKCNQSLTNLRMKLKANPSDNEKKQIVNLIKDFANDSKNIVNYVEKNGNKITMEYAMECETDEFGVIVETVTGKIVKEILLWHLIGTYVKHDSPYGKLEFNKRHVILGLLAPFTLGITGIIAVAESISHEYNLLNNGIEEMVAVELTKDIMTAYSLLTRDDINVSINSKIGKFKKALKNIKNDAKYSDRCSNEKLRKDIMELSARANAVLEAVNKNSKNVDSNVLINLINSMEIVLEDLYDKNKLKNLDKSELKTKILERKENKKVGDE